MATAIPNWSALVAAIQEFQPAIRVKWTGDDEPPPWEPWVIIPVESYLETGSIGPVPFREVEWVEIDPHRKNDRTQLVDADQSVAISLALSDSHIAFKVVDGIYRVMADAGQ